jgi:CRISPR-associated exonuclease Cas4
MIASLLNKIFRKSQLLKYGKTIYIDHSSQNVSPLFSQKYQLTGKPDFIFEKDGEVVPVEIKSRPMPYRGPFEGHVLQLMSYCLLCEECYNMRPKYGVLKYSTGNPIEIPYTDEMKQKLIKTFEEMRTADESMAIYINPNKCKVCSLRNRCDKWEKYKKEKTIQY